MKPLLLVAILLPTAACCSFPVAAAEVVLAPQQGLLLLTNGELLEGTITAAGDYYDVRVRDGQIRVRRSQVALVAQDLAACYRFKRGEIQIERAQDHLDLADWCMQKGLFDEAAAELDAARHADAAHPKIPLLETRLRFIREAPKAAPPKIAQANPAQDSPAATKSDDKLVESGGTLPPAGIETFTNHIQPLLLNNCTGSGCHVGQSTAAMRLERMPANRYAGRKSTHRNLRSVLSQIDRNNPLASRLLTAPLEPHGGARQAIFSDRKQSQYAQLVRWTYLVSGSAPPAVEPTMEERTAPLAERGPSASPVAGAVDLPVDASPATDGAAAETNAGTGIGGTAGPQAIVGAAGMNDAAMARAQAALLESAALDHAGTVHPSPTNQKPLPAQPGADYVPRDPFDPEIFNRRYFGR